MKNTRRTAFLFIAIALIVAPQVRGAEVPQENIARVMHVAQTFKTICNQELFDGAPPLFFYCVVENFCHSMNTDFVEIERIFCDIESKKFSQQSQDTIERWTQKARKTTETAQKSCEDALRSTSTYLLTDEPELLRQLFLPFGEFLRAYANYLIASTLASCWYLATSNEAFGDSVCDLDTLELENSWDNITNQISDWLNRHMVPSDDADYDIFEKQFMPKQMAMYYQAQVNEYGEYVRPLLSISIGGRIRLNTVTLLYDFYEHLLSSHHDHDCNSDSSIGSSSSETIPHSREKRLSADSVSSD